MFRHLLRRCISYDPQKQWKTMHSDNRTAYTFVQTKENNVDSAQAMTQFAMNVKQSSITWATIIGFFFYVLHKSKSMRKKFEINYLNSLPLKEFESEDYDFKFWEAVLSTPSKVYGNSITPETVCKDSYVLLYLGNINGDTVTMQRFGRLQRFIQNRKSFPIKTVFICLDENCDPETLYHYGNIYYKDMITSFIPSDEALFKIKDIFQNIGCIYVLEKNSGNVIDIVDPTKHPVEVLSNKVTHTISQIEDLKISRQVVANKIDIRLGKNEALEYKPPTY